MDDPGWTWPAWKFGLKRDDLFNSLHEQYNTFTFSLQDPEAFHADVCEISHDAESTQDFHRLMADRRQQRLRELHESLESLAVEIIANPKLMESKHWNYAIQLFRTKSFDSLVRYFASYLPDGYLNRYEPRSTQSSFSDASSVHTVSTTTSSVDGAAADFTFLDGPDVTEEPYQLDDDVCCDHGVTAPLSPPETDSAASECSAPSPGDDTDSNTHSTHPPSRSMSFSGSESGHFGSGFHRSLIHDDDDTSQSGSVDTAASIESDCAASHSSLDSVDGKEQDISYVDEDDDDLLTAQFPEDSFDAFDAMNDDTIDTIESDTPTPRQEGASNSYVDYKSILCRRLPTPHRRSPSPKAHRAAGSPPLEVRRSPDEAHSKIHKQKPIPDASRKRPKGRI
jgi:hypothetical protein